MNKGRYCPWKWNKETDFWHTGCEQVYLPWKFVYGMGHVRVTDGLKERRYFYCPGCGREISEQAPKGETK